MTRRVNHLAKLSEARRLLKRSVSGSGEQGPCLAHAASRPKITSAAVAAVTIRSTGMTTESPINATLLVGTVNDAAHARNAFDSLMTPDSGGDKNLAVAVYGTSGT